MAFDRGYVPAVPLNSEGVVVKVYEEGELPGKKREQGYDVRVITTAGEELDLFFYEKELLGK